MLNPVPIKEPIPISGPKLAIGAQPDPKSGQLSACPAFRERVVFMRSGVAWVLQVANIFRDCAG
jgi:hypothetical protein